MGISNLNKNEKLERRPYFSWKAKIAPECEVKGHRNLGLDEAA